MQEHTRKMLSQKIVIALGNCLNRDVKLLASGTMTTIDLAARYSKEIGHEVTPANVVGLARRMEMEIKPKRKTNSVFHYNSGAILALCKCVDALAAQLGANDIDGLVEVRRHIDSKVKQDFTDNGQR